MPRIRTELRTEEKGLQEIINLCTVVAATRR
jgi:hypothetical protein